MELYRASTVNTIAVIIMHQQITTLRYEVVYDNNYRVVGSQIESFVEGSAEQVRVHVDQVIVLLMRYLEMDKHCHGDEKSSYSKNLTKGESDLTFEGETLKLESETNIVFGC